MNARQWGRLWTITAGCTLAVHGRAARAQTGADTTRRGIETVDTSAVELDSLKLIVTASITLHDAIDSALRFSPVMTRADAVTKVAHAAERFAHAEYLPYVAVTSSVSRNGLPSLPEAPLSSVIGPTTVGAGGAGGGGGQGADSIGVPSVGSSSEAASTGASAARVHQLATTTTTGPTPASGVSSPSASTNEPYVPSAALVAGWDVFTGGRRQADLHRADAEARAAESISLRQRFVIVDSVKMAFYEVLRGEELDSLAREQVARTHEDWREAVGRHDAGTATTSEVLQFQLDLSNARVALLQADIDRNTGAYALGRLTGIDGAVDARVDSSMILRPLALSDSAIVTLALAAAPTLLAARDSARAAEAGAVAIRTQYVPTVHLGTSYTWTPSGVTSSAQRPGWAVDVATSYPIFNGFDREYQVELATQASTVARVTAQDQARQVRSETERLLGSIALARRQVALALQAVATAREAYRVDFARYHLGLVTALELMTTEQSLTQTEQQLVMARYNYFLARADLEVLVGREL